MWAKRSTAGMLRGTQRYSIFISMTLCALLCACAGQPGRDVAFQPAAGETQAGADAQALSAVRNAPVPAGVKPETWRALQDELARVIVAVGRASAPAGRGGFQPPNAEGRGGFQPPANRRQNAAATGKDAAATKTTSSPPVTGGSRAVLTLDMSGGGNGMLKWGLYLHGDYNQDGVVGLADLAPLGQRFGEVSPGGLGSRFPADSSGAVLDGSWDGSINLADVTPIGQNWGRIVAGYRVYRSHDPADVPQVAADANGAGAELVADVPLADAIVAAGMRKRFELALAEDPTDWLFWVRPYDGANEGTPSNSVPPTGADNLPPIAVLGAEPSSGLAPLTVQLQGFSSGDLDGIIVKYEWDFDGVVGGENWVNTGAQGWVEHVYDAPGDYLPMLRVTDNAGGQATDTVLVKVRVPHPPVAALSVTPDSGPVVLHVVFDAGGSTDQEGPIAKYEWDWQSDGTYDYDGGTTSTADFYYYAPGTVTATVRVTDIDGLTSTAQASVNATAGATWHTDVATTAHYENSEGEALIGPPSLMDATGAAIAPHGVPGVFYRRRTTAPDVFKLEYVCVNAQAGGWTAPATVVQSAPVSQYGDIYIAGMIDGCPAVAYQDRVGSPYETFYIRALNPQGAQWMSPVKIAGSGEPRTSFQILDGTQAFLDSEGQLYKADDTQGAIWALLGIAEVPIGLHSFLLAGGNPAVCFKFGNSICFKRTLDPLGTQWPALPAVITSDTAVTDGGADVILSAGNPAIIYRSSVLNQIFFIRAADREGSAWGQPVALAAFTRAEYSLSDPLSLALVDGRPFVLYRDSVSGGVCFMAANTQDGASWSLPTPDVPWQGGPQPDFFSWSGPIDIASSPALAFINRADAPSGGTDYRIDYCNLY